jgi:hypothetical protein
MLSVEQPFEGERREGLEESKHGVAGNSSDAPGPRTSGSNQSTPNLVTAPCTGRLGCVGRKPAAPTSRPRKEGRSGANEGAVHDDVAAAARPTLSRTGSSINYSYGRHQLGVHTSPSTRGVRWHFVSSLRHPHGIPSTTTTTTATTNTTTTTAANNTTTTTATPPPTTTTTTTTIDHATSTHRALDGLEVLVVHDLAEVRQEGGQLAVQRQLLKDLQRIDAVVVATPVQDKHPVGKLRQQHVAPGNVGGSRMATTNGRCPHASGCIGDGVGGGDHGGGGGCGELAAAPSCRHTHASHAGRKPHAVQLSTIETKLRVQRGAPWRT